MVLRKLLPKDVSLMLEWMQDPSIVENLQANFAAKTWEDCIAFIDKANTSTKDVHMAITDDQDEYMGTVSLKHIENGCAEFAITVRKEAMGKGFAKWGMSEIIRFGKEKLDLKAIYWCVDPANERAVRFYDKNGYLRIGIHSDEQVKGIVQKYYTDKQIQNLLWYQSI